MTETVNLEPTTPMKRVSRDGLPELYQQGWDRLMSDTGDSSFLEVFGNAPELMDFMFGQFYAKIFFAGRVDVKIKQLVRLRLSTEHGCRTCNLGNVPSSLDSGCGQDQIDAIGDYENGPFSDAEKAALRLADRTKLTNPTGQIDQTLYDQLIAHFDDAQICEIALVASYLTGLFKMLFVLDLVRKEEYCPFLPTSDKALEVV